jgi:DNA-binding MarR family transcriptional regulator
MNKRQVLELLLATPDLDAATVAQHLVCSAEAAGMSLLRLSRQNLVQRLFDPGDRLFYYQISPKGRARLRYWNAHRTQDGR